VRVEGVRVAHSALLLLYPQPASSKANHPSIKTWPIVVSI